MGSIPMIARQVISLRILLALRIALYAVLFTPLLFGNSFIFPFIVLKTHVFQALVGVIAALYAAWRFLDRSSPAPRWTPLRVALALGFLAAFVSSVSGVDLMRSLWSTQERGLGLVALLHFAVLAFVLAEVRSHISLTRYATVSIAVSVFAASFSFVQIVDPMFFLESSGGPVGFGGRPGSFLGNPTFLASYLLPHIFLALWLSVVSWRERRGVQTALYAGGSLLSIAVIFMTQTRGALIGLTLGFFVLGVMLVFRHGSVRLAKRVTLRSVGLALLALIVAAGVGFWFTRSAALWQSVPGVRRLTTLSLTSPEIQPRLITLAISWDAFRERPILGHGFENFKYPFDRHYDPKLLRYGFGETYFDKPHNVFLEHLVDGGIVGLVAYCALFLSLGYVALRSRDQFVLGLAVSGALAAHVVNNAFVFETFGSWLAFFLVFALVDAGWLSARVPRDAREPAHQSPAPFRHREFLAVCVLGAAFAWVVWNAGVLYANNREYWVVNYFLNRMPERALQSYRAAAHVPLNPFRNDIQRDFASAVVQSIQQRIELPDEAMFVREALDAMDAVVTDKPHDYFPRVSYIDSAATLSPDDAAVMARSEQYLAEALALSPRRQQIRFVEAKLRMVQGRTDEALQAMRAAIDLDPEIAESHFDYALIAFEAERVADGFLALATAERLGRTPRTTPEMRIVANRYADAGNYPKAIELYGKALGLNPDDLESRLKLGIVYFYAGDILAARAELEIVARSTNIRQAPSYELLKPIFDAVGVPIP